MPVAPAPGMRIGVVLGLVLVAETAHAFCRTTTVKIDPEFAPTTEHPCWTKGLPVYWKSACVGYSLQKNVSRQVSFDEAETAMRTAFGQWTNASCGASKASIDVRFLGPVACHEVQYNQNGGNANVIMFDDDVWPYDGGSAGASDVLGLTTVTYDEATGELLDADMELNTAQYSITATGPVPPDGYDLLSIVTHESGHFLGLAHSTDGEATMFSSYRQGTTSMRSLSADDVTGICSIYRADGTRGTLHGSAPAGPCDPTPEGGYASPCGGCSASPGPASHTPFVLLVAASVITRRRGRVSSWR